MPQPQSLTDFATPVAVHAEQRASARSVRRFAEVRARVSGDLPYVSVGSVYEDMDPRCEGRRVQVLRVAKDARVLVRVMSASTNQPRTAAESRRDTVGDTHWIAQIRFREGSRGFRYLYRSSETAVEAYLVACEFATLLDRDLTLGDVRLVGALTSLLPGRLVRDYLAQWRRLGNLAAFLDEHGVAGLLANAAVFDTAGHDAVVTSLSKARRAHTRATSI